MGIGGCAFIARVTDHPLDTHHQRLRRAQDAEIAGMPQRGLGSAPALISCQRPSIWVVTPSMAIFRLTSSDSAIGGAPIRGIDTVRVVP